MKWKLSRFLPQTFCQTSLIFCSSPVLQFVTNNCTYHHYKMPTKITEQEYVWIQASLQCGRQINFFQSPVVTVIWYYWLTNLNLVFTKFMVEWQTQHCWLNEIPLFMTSCFLWKEFDMYVTTPRRYYPFLSDTKSARYIDYYISMCIILIERNSSQIPGISLANTKLQALVCYQGKRM